MANCKNKRVSDVLTPDVISSLESGGRYLIDASCDTGKSFWARRVLTQYCADTHKHMLILSPLNMIKKQGDCEIKEYFTEVYGDLEKEYEVHEESVYNFSYQKAAQSKSTRKYSEYNFDNYDYIVCDEAHTLISYAEFGFPFEIKKKIDATKAAVIFITATPSALCSLYDGVKTICKMRASGRRVDKLAYSTKPEIIQAQIKENIDAGNKALVFCGSAKAAKKQADNMGGSFICSKYNKYAEHSNDAEFNNIIQNERFDAAALYTTTCMDMGVNIKDAAVNLIVINGLFPIDEIMQIRGRLRKIDGAKGIRVLVREPSGHELAGKIQSLKDRLDYYDDCSNDGNFDAIAICTDYMNGVIKEFPKWLIRNDNGCYEVDTALIMKYKTELSWYMAVKNRGFKGYTKCIVDKFGVMPDCVFGLDEEAAGHDIDEFRGKKIFKNENAVLHDYLGGDFALQDSFQAVLRDKLNMRAGDCCAMEKVEEELMSPHEIVAAVEKWGEDNPPNTIAAELLKHYPVADTNDEGTPIDLFAHSLGYKEPPYCFDDDNPKSCRECWRRTPEEAAI